MNHLTLEQIKRHFQIRHISSPKFGVSVHDTSEIIAETPRSAKVQASKMHPTCVGNWEQVKETEWQKLDHDNQETIYLTQATPNKEWEDPKC